MSDQTRESSSNIKQIRLPSQHPTTDDQFERRQEAQTIIALLCGAKTDSIGLTVGVYGSWGSGKSSLLDLIEEELKQNNAKTPIIVRFDAWKFSREQHGVWVGLIESILEKIESFEFHLKRFWKSIKWNEVWKWLLPKLVKIVVVGILFCVSILAVYQLWVWITNPKLINSWQLITGLLGVPSAWALFTLLTGQIFTLAQQASQSTLKFNLEFPSHLLRESLRTGKPFPFQMFQEELADILQSQNRRVVVLIDDLDRCHPDEIVPVFEALKYFSPEGQSANRSDIRKTEKSAPIVFVLALDYDAICRALLVHFAARLPQADQNSDASLEDFVRKYLEKVVQVPVMLAPIPRRSLENYLQNHVKKFAKQNPIFENEPFDEITKILSVGLEYPRAVNRVFGVFVTLVEVLEIRGLLREKRNDKLRLTAFLARLQDGFPDLYHQILRNPYWFYALHATFTAKENQYFPQDLLDEIERLGFPPEMNAAMQWQQWRNSRRLTLLFKAISDLADLLDLNTDFLPVLWRLGTQSLEKASMDERQRQIDSILRDVADQFSADLILRGGNPAEVLALNTGFSQIDWYKALNDAHQTGQLAALERLLFAARLQAQQRRVDAARTIFDPTFEVMRDNNLSERVRLRATYTAVRAALHLPPGIETEQLFAELYSILQHQRRQRTLLLSQYPKFSTAMRKRIYADHPLEVRHAVGRITVSSEKNKLVNELIEARTAALPEAIEDLHDLIGMLSNPNAAEFSVAHV